MGKSKIFQGFPSFSDPVEFAHRVRVFEISGESFGSIEEGKVIPYWEPDELVHTLEESYGNAVVFRAIDSNLLTFYPSRFLPNNQNLGNRDLLGEMVSLCRQKGFHVFAYCCIGGAIHKDIVPLYRDWSMINPDGTPVVKTGNWGKDAQLVICINNPSYIKAYTEAVKEIVREYPVSGIFLTGRQNEGAVTVNTAGNYFRRNMVRNYLFILGKNMRNYQSQ